MSHDHKTLTDHQIKELALSTEVNDRLHALAAMRRRAEKFPLPQLFTFAENLVKDPDNNCRWQAMIVIGEFIPSDPESVWRIVCQYGESTDEDMRTCVACVLLEHLLEHHFDLFYPKVEKLIKMGNELFIDTLSRCWVFVDDNQNKKSLQKLLKSAKDQHTENE